MTKKGASSKLRITVLLELRIVLLPGKCSDLSYNAQNQQRVDLEYRERAMDNRRHVALGTISFMVCFAAWGLIAAFAPRFRETFQLTPSQTALLVAIPVSLARIPMGILTDRFGSRAIFSILMAAVAIPVWIVPGQSTLLRPADSRVPSWVSRIFVRHRRGR
jgi:hypothetical protein